MAIEFRSGKAYLIDASAQTECDYTVSGDKLTIKNGGQEMVVTYNKDDSLTTPWGIMHKVNPASPAKIATRCYFTVDNGATWFADAITHIPPYDHNGQVAVKAHVYSCNGKQFVGYLEKYTDDMMETLVDPNHGEPSSSDLASNTLVKRPGESTWQLLNTNAGKEILNIKSPDGSTTGITEVMPAQ